MVEIVSNEIIELKMTRLKPSEYTSLEFIRRTSSINEKGKFVLLKFGGTLDEFVTLVTLRVIYKSNLDKEVVFDKLCEYAEDIKEDLAHDVFNSLNTLPKDIL